MTARPTVVVVGASLAGLNAVEGLRDGGFDGRIIVVGAEQHLPYDRPPLSKDVLAGETPPEQTSLRTPDDVEALDAEWELGRSVVGLDPAARTVTLDDGRSLAFDGLVAATGASPRTLPGQPPYVHLLRTLEDCSALAAALEGRPRVAVVGAGFIGSEVAATARQRGCEVTVVEAMAVPLAHVLGGEMGRALSALHLDHGVRMQLGVGVEGFSDAGVRLADGSIAEADVVVVGVGVAPVVDWLGGAGVELRNGVACDETCAFGPAMVAAGDVAEWRNDLFGERMRVEHWDNAIQQGRHAAATLLAHLGGLQGQPYTPVPWFWSDQYDAKIQYAGRAAPTDDVTVIDGSVEERKFAAVYGRGGRVVAALGVDKPRPVAVLRRKMAEGITVEEARGMFA